MGWISPLLLLGTALLAVPWFLHRRRREKAAIRFSSLMFLPAGPPPVPRRRLRHIWLMLLRMAALLLLAAAFARPYSLVEGGGPTLMEGEGLHVVALDVSASMGVAGRWDQARGQVEALLDSLPAADRVCLLAFGRRPRLVVPWGSAGLVAAGLDDLEPSWEGTDYAAVLEEAERLLMLAPTDGTARRVVHLVSDLQASGMPPVDQSWRLAAGIALRPVGISAEAPPNLAVERLSLRQGAAGQVEVRVRLKNWSDQSVSVPVRLVVVDSVLGKPVADRPSVRERQIEVLPQSAVQSVFSVPWDGQSQLSGYVETQDDGYAGDDRRYFAWNPSARRRLSLVGPAYAALLRAALPAAGAGWDLVEADKDWSQQLGAGGPDLLLLAADLGADEAKAVQAYLAGGGRLLAVVPADPSGPMISLLSGLGVATTGTIENAAGAGWEWVDFAHPLFSPFRQPRFNDFSALRFFRYPALQPRAVDESVSSHAQVRVLARFGASGTRAKDTDGIEVDGTDIGVMEVNGVDVNGMDLNDIGLNDIVAGDPAVLVSALGAGNALVWAGDLRLQDSNLIRSPRFVALLDESLDYLSPIPQPSPDWTVGQALVEARDPGVEPWRGRWITGDLAPGPVWSGQDLAEAPLPGDMGAVLSRPGVVRGAGGVRAVNVAAAESDPRHLLPVELVLRLGGGPSRQVHAAAASTAAAARRFEYGRPLLGLLLLFICGESAYAAYLGRQGKQNDAA
jgi:hypothetical protein